MKKEIIILVIIVGLVIVGIAGSKWLVNSGTKAVPGATTTEYQDEKFGYRFVYPNAWTTKRVTLTPGYVEVIPPAGKQYSLYFWYKDSKAIKNAAELEAFVRDDATYAEKNQGTKTIEISAKQLGNLSGFVYDYQDKDGTVSRAYYVADFTPTADQNIFVWTGGILNKTNSLDSVLSDQDVQSILGSYRLLE
ncbi:MAG: hypothetical protein WCK91_02360 [bacterium]